MSSANDDKIPFGKALGIILGSVFLISGSACLLFFFYYRIEQDRMHDEKYRIIAIAQKSQKAESLKTVYLAELLGLSVDRSTNLNQFDVNKARKTLLSCPLIKSAKVEKIPPGTLYVDYTLRKPIAFLGDYTNTAIDSQGFLFPFKPFFTPKKLPEIYIGLSAFGDDPKGMEGEMGSWGMALKNPRAQLGLQIYKLLMKSCCHQNTSLLKIDTSKAFDLSYGKRQIVVVLQDHLIKENGGKTIVCYYPKILRLSINRFSQELAYYLALNKKIMEQERNLPAIGEEAFYQAPPTIIDLRVPQLAFIRNL